MMTRFFLVLRILKNSIHFYNILVVSLARYQKYMICQISFNKFSDLLPVLTCAVANL